MSIRACFLPLLLLGSASFVSAADWVEGDYGPVISTHIDPNGVKLGDMKQISPEALGNFVFRGRVISLNAEKTINICFDTEHMRYAAGWSGGYLDWKGADKNMGPASLGEVQFTTNIGPGLSRGGVWDDPREPREGPLPKEWAHYKGLYLHGGQVVLEYTVGGARVLEMPAAESRDGLVIFERHITLFPGGEPFGLLLCEEASGGEQAAERIAANEESHVQVASGKESLVARIVGAPAGAEWETSSGRIHLLLPAVKQPASFTVLLARTAAATHEAFLAHKAAPPLDLTTLTGGGPPRWEETLTTQGKPSDDVDSAYVLDELTAPEENPWNSRMRFGGLDFFEDGRAAVSTWDGDVWIVAGLDDSLGKLRWKRFATGLHQPLGLKIINGVIYTAGRDQITRLHDLNNDGEADWYENFNNDAGLTPQRHEFALDLQTDAAGNIYYCRSGHYMPSLRGENCCVMRLPPDGSRLEVVARGLREPNGMSISPEGEITVGDNEGNGIPQTPLYRVHQGDFLGFPGAFRTGDERGPWQDALLWLPREVDGSHGGQVWVTSKRFGPLAGELLHTSYGNCSLMHVMLDRTNDRWQGMAVPFPLTFGSGVMRARFHARDGQLYLCGLRGWGSAAARDGQFCRVRYTGKPYYQPVGWRVTERGIDLTFSVPLDAKFAADDENWAAECYSVKFGSVPSRGKEEIFIEAAELSADGRTVSLEFEENLAATNLEVQFNIQAANGAEISGKLYGTINHVP